MVDFSLVNESGEAAQGMKVPAIVTAGGKATCRISLPQLSVKEKLSTKKRSRPRRLAPLCMI